MARDSCLACVTAGVAAGGAIGGAVVFLVIGILFLLGTSKTEVYTWGKGANGRLGHGDTDDRNSPSLVEALKDKQVKSIACGISFTAAICLHKWVSGVDQSMCSGCRLPFNFKRKRHNCYNCGLVYCHSDTQLGELLPRRTQRVIKKNLKYRD
ncbi:hypothetical protein POTOM_034365 [Populus tomentosa]|uniref:FYVE zinc finger domain-containing protein n=1 Tax=Populus tomentosa TaxID=118781 RepID=A0A8X7YWZ3_POPTO|nr:hypothetical protein POTOM_034365 [Populus tomentosa]